mmetsp:Transcript_13454/g.17720  ORF Transcript_13454/g.17720 Transcript_13454/m.17720 type:complete len:219 (-) Transcript_13454:442-1098(-)
MYAPKAAPISGPRRYIQKQLRGPGIAAEPHPVKKVTSRGPKSLAGFMQHWVNGPNKQISMQTTNPIKSGAKSLLTNAELFGSVIPLIENIKSEVAQTSTKKAFAGDSKLFGYSPKARADLKLSGSPLVIPWSISNCLMKLEKTAKFASAPVKAPSIWAVTYPLKSFQENPVARPCRAVAKLTAGLMWAPETDAVQYTAMATPIPQAEAICQTPEKAPL